MSDRDYITSLVEKSRIAQRRMEEYGQEEVDRLVRAMGKAVFDHAEMLARMAVDETGMGVYEHKVAKNKGKSRMIWHHLKGKKSMGVLRELQDEGVIEIAKPKGVVASITPCTNPAPTTMGNAMMAVKCRNSIIVAPHPRARKTSLKVVELINAAIQKLDAPENLVQVIEEPTVELSNLLMQSCDVSIATGGPGMVHAAYSSGKPAYGVGAGNVQCIIDRGYDESLAVPKIIEGRAFDNGIICSGEQTAILPEEKFEEIIEEFKENGAFFTDDATLVEKFRTTLFDEAGVMNKDLVGQSAVVVAAAAGVEVPENTKIILLKPEYYGAKDCLSKEKMCPVVTAYSYREWDEAVQIAYDNLNVDGKGHSVSIHSNDRTHIMQAAEALPVCRILINQVSATMNGGAFTNGFAPTTTMGCGTWGNSSFDGNFDYIHLYNISRVGFEKPDAVIPSDDEIWGKDV